MEYLILAFATYYLSEAINTTDGPFNIFYKLKHMKYSKAFECYTCLAAWVGLLLALMIATDWKSWLLSGLAAAGVAVFLNYITE